MSTGDARRGPSLDSLFPQPSALDLVRILARHKWSALAVILVTMISALVWIFVIRDEYYEASARVLVKLGREMAAPSTVIGGVQPVMTNRSPEVNSEIDILHSAELINKLVDEMQLDKIAPPPVPKEFFPRVRHTVKQWKKEIKDWWEGVLVTAGLKERLSPREKVVLGLQKGLVIKPPKDSYVMVVSMLLPIREGAGHVLNRLLAHYMELRARLYQDRQAVPLFQKETQQSAAELAAVEKELQEFERLGGLSAIEKQRELMISQVADAQTELDKAELERAESARKVQLLESEIRKPEPNFAALGEFDKDSFNSSILLQLATLQKEREQLRLTELDQGARIRNNRQQFQELLRLARSNLQSVLLERENRVKSRAERRGNLAADLQRIQDRHMAWTALKRKISMLEANYLFYSKKLEEAAADAAVAGANVSNVVVVDSAVDPVLPVGMAKTTLLGLAFAAAILAALCWITVLEFFDHRIHTPEDLEKSVGAPLFAAAPLVKRRELDWPSPETRAPGGPYRAGRA